MEPTNLEEQPGLEEAVAGKDLGDEARVAIARAGMIDHDEAARLADMFKLLADPNRARLLHALRCAGELKVGDLAELVHMGESNVSHALRLLRTAGVVRNRRDGRVIYYALDDDHVGDLLDRSLSHLRHLTDPTRPDLVGTGSIRPRRSNNPF